MHSETWSRLCLRVYMSLVKREAPIYLTCHDKAYGISESQCSSEYLLRHWSLGRGPWLLMPFWQWMHCRVSYSALESPDPGSPLLHFGFLIPDLLLSLKCAGLHDAFASARRRRVWVCGSFGRWPELGYFVKTSLTSFRQNSSSLVQRTFLKRGHEYRACLQFWGWQHRWDGKCSLMQQSVRLRFNPFVRILG